MASGAVQALPRLEAGVDFGARADADDAIAANRHGAVFDHAVLCVLGDHVARAPDPVRRRCGENGNTEYHRRDAETQRKAKQ